VGDDTASEAVFVKICELERAFWDIAWSRG